jgi:flagellar biosynthesis/type III secretory pathway protein FliH
LRSSEVNPVVAAYKRKQAEILRAEVLEARTRADAILAEAEANAAGLQRAAEAAAAESHARAQREGYEAGLAEAITASATLSQAEATRDARQLDANVALARLLAERLLGKALELDGQLVVAMAAEVLREVRGLRSVKIFAHEDDVGALREALDAGTLGPQVLVVSARSDLQRGDLVLEAESGRLEAKLGDRLERLARSLREALA